MDRLDRILAAEDAAREAVRNAGALAAQAVSEARVTAARVLRDGRERTAAEAAAHRDGILSAAQETVDQIGRAAEAEATRLLAEARARENAALTAVLEVLKGR